MKFTTETGSVYVVDTSAGYWRKNDDGVCRLHSYGAGISLTEPWVFPDDWQQDRLPVVGEHLYVYSPGVWWVSTKIVEVTECST